MRRDCDPFERRLPPSKRLANELQDGILEGFVAQIEFKPDVVEPLLRGEVMAAIGHSAVKRFEFSDGASRSHRAHVGCKSLVAHPPPGS